MIKKMTLAGAALLAITSCTVSESYQVKGFVNAENPVQWIAISANGEDSLLASCTVNNGEFETTFNSPLPDIVYLEVGNKRIPIFFESEVKEYEIRLDSTGVYTKGGALQATWEDYCSQNIRFQEQKDSVELIYRQAEKADDLFAKMHELAIYQEIEQAQKNFEDSLVKQNDNVVSAAIVLKHSKNPLAKRALIDKTSLLGQQALLTSAGKAVKAQIENIDRMEREKIAPDFTQNDVNGNPVTLYGIKAKVKILDFWASWCGPCRAETPNVRRMYEQYRADGLEIISVSLDTKKENWIQAIEKDQMNWINTSDLKGWKNAVAQRYGIHSIPAIFLLDENNRIIGQNLRGKQLEEAIRKALGK